MYNYILELLELDIPFSFDRLYRHPGSLIPYDQGGNRKRIAIIGGGIAGLVSAYELSQLNHQVTLLAEFDAVICTIPETALSRIKFDPILPNKQWEAINNLGYCSASKTLLHCTARPWEFVDNIYSSGSFTDLNIEKSWYPADNAQLDSKESFQPHFIAKDQDISYQPSVLTAE